MIYTWIDTQKNPIHLPAPQYMSNIEIWILGKIQDQSLFPTDNFTSAPPLPSAAMLAEMANDPNYWPGKLSGFPQRFPTECKNMYKQMFRCYAHMFWSHYLDFYHLHSDKTLITSFLHFINVGRQYDLLTDKDCEPMAPLIAIFEKNGWLPKNKGGDAAQTPKTETAGGAGGAGGAGAGSGASTSGTAAA